MKFASDFEHFLVSVVNLDQGRIDRLQGHVNAIENFLAADDTIGELFIDLIPSGSWAHRSIIRPVGAFDEFDADVLLFVTEKPAWAAKDYIGEVYSAFRRSGTYASKVQRKTRCARIDYAGDFHVDIVPYLERGGRNFITNRLEPVEFGRFELSNPEAFTTWVDERERFTNGNFIKSVRLLKYLRDHKNTFTCKSIILKTLLGNEVNQIEATAYPTWFADVPSTLNTLLSKLASSLPLTMPAVLDPGGTGDNFSDRYRDDWNYKNFREWIVFYAAKVKAAYEESDRETSIRLWREVFGESFKSGVALKSAAMAAEPGLTTRAPSERFITEPPYSYVWRLDPSYWLRVEGRCLGLRAGAVTRRNGFRQFHLTSHGNRVPKNRSLRFDATTNVPGPYRMFWKVRNEGSEAAAVGQLRGEISEDQGGEMKSETTSYAGYHYVDCYVVKGEAVVAYDRQRVVVV